ncbi:hypothetical protein PoB_001750200 [Plakobranchus ocellatus]|uniref:Uncharacterized protein n=1 Tax=Plakobranchus ocellatus TaxID=259542 RepID=A0AAV3Z8Z4_9GAST|nr:hypothetical protein PoB_001750200 [Plakobranchus ocellatus]
MVALKSVASAYMDARPNKTPDQINPSVGNTLCPLLSNQNPIVLQYVFLKGNMILDPTDVVAGLNILRRGTDRPVFKVILIWLREVLLIRPPGTEVNLMLLTRMLARVNLDLVRAAFLVILLVFSAVARDMSAVNVRAAPGRQMLLLWCQSYLHIAVPPKWIVILGLD